MSSFEERLFKIEQLHYLIKRKQTGTAEELSRKLQVSKRSLHYMIDLLKSLGAPIYFCNIRKTYCYSEEVDFSLKFKRSK